MILGIDFGLKNIGLALSAGELVEPLGHLKSLSLDKTISRINQLCQDHQIEKIVIGLPQGSLKLRIEQFTTQLKKVINLPIIFQDETLTSQEAVKKSLHQPLKKRQQSQHAIAAALILQAYLDSRF
ncbi:Holliday junction resolvase RuvX [Patescibacteria group bacterium]|nr:Holliday junction resolvase RuvX [Patescibacteria group bacterium]